MLVKTESKLNKIYISEKLLKAKNGKRDRNLLPKKSTRMARVAASRPR